MNIEYNESDRTISTPRWYTDNPGIDSALLIKTYIGKVRDSRDPQNMGRLLVWIPELSGDVNKIDNWIICSYCSPFAGASFVDTNLYIDSKESDVINDFYKSPDARFKHRTPEYKKDEYGGRQSYGMWFMPPDIGNEVLVTFVNGDPNKAVWFGCLFSQDMNQMVPGVGSKDVYDGVSTNDIGPVIDPDYDSNEPKPETGDATKKKKYTPLYNGLKLNQGLEKDLIRGQSTSSARRETPSEVFGILTPDGNQMVMDDHQDNEFIRMRTKSGAQLLIHQTEGMIYAISRDGKSWLELNNEGNVDIYGSMSVSVHAEKGDVNVKSGNNINIQAENDINMRAGNDIKIEVGGNLDIIADGNMASTSGKKLSIKSGAEMGITSNNDMGLTSGGTMQMQGGPFIKQNTGKGVQATESIRPITHTPTGPSTNSLNNPWVSGQAYPSGSNIVKRVPQHEPWIEHNITLRGTNNHVVEGDIDPDIPTGATSSTATKPNDITLPDGKRFEGKSITSKKESVYIQVPDVPDCALRPITNRQVSTNGLDHIKQSEGFENSIYKDQAGLDTIGVGHLITKEEKELGTFSSGAITDEEANALLLKDLDSAQRSVRGCVTQPVTQDQYDSMVSLAFNIGGGAFCSSTLVKKINEGEYKEVPNQMMRWNKVRVSGILTESNGLTARRRSEADLFAKAPEPCE